MSDKIIKLNEDLIEHDLKAPVRSSVEETLTYMDFLHSIELGSGLITRLIRLNREIKRRTKVIGAFLDGRSALMLVCARPCCVAVTSWGARCYMNMDYLFKPK